MQLLDGHDGCGDIQLHGVGARHLRHHIALVPGPGNHVAGVRDGRRSARQGRRDPCSNQTDAYVRR